MKLFVSCIIACLSFCISPCRAASSLVLHLKDSTVVVCSLVKEPQMAFGKSTITLSSTEGTVGEWNFSDVVSWNFSDIDDAIEEVMGDYIEIKGDRIEVRGKKQVAVCDMNGRQMKPSLSTSAGVTTVGLGGLPKGAYVLKVGRSSVKFMVK